MRMVLISLMMLGSALAQTQVNLATQVKGTLPVTNGGNGATPTASDQTPVTTSSTVGTYAQLPNCAADSAHALVYNTSTHEYSCVTLSNGAFYQTLESNGTPVAQAVAANFSSAFTLTPASGSTLVGLAVVSPCTNSASSGCVVLPGGSVLAWVQGTITATNSCNIGSPAGLCSEPNQVLAWPSGAFSTACYAPWVNSTNNTLDVANTGSGQTFSNGYWVIVGTPTITSITVQHTLPYSDAGVNPQISGSNFLPTAYCIGH
jgi:hypothetical protein